MSLNFYFEEPILTLGGHFHFYFKQCVKKRRCNLSRKNNFKIKNMNRALLIHYENIFKI